jgi:hypothetical protein
LEAPDGRESRYMPRLPGGPGPGSMPLHDHTAAAKTLSSHTIYLLLNVAVFNPHCFTLVISSTSISGFKYQLERRLASWLYKMVKS